MAKKRNKDFERSDFFDRDGRDLELHYEQSSIAEYMEDKVHERILKERERGMRKAVSTHRSLNKSDMFVFYDFLNWMAFIGYAMFAIWIFATVCELVQLL